MNKKIFYILFLIFSAGFLFGQSKTGTTIGQFLKIDPSARASAMGNANTSIFGEASSLFYNAASLGRLKNVDVQFTYNQWLADITYNYAVAAVPLEGIGTFALQLTSLNSGDIDVRTVEAPLGTGERYSVTDFAFGLGFGLMLTDRVSVGVQANYIQETIWHSSLSTFGLNFGVQYQVEENGLTIGASILNFGPRAGYNGRDLYINYDFNHTKYGDNDLLPAELRTDAYSLPTSFRVGVSYPFILSEDNKFTLAVDAFHPNDNDESVSVGAEWQFLNSFSLRGGYRDLFIHDSEGGLVFGAGVRVDVLNNYNLRFDYAWADYGRLEQAHRFTLSLGFN
jgi:long-subunit fatty acid transport protein